MTQSLNLLDIPVELVSEILTYCQNPKDFNSISRVCKLLNRKIAEVYTTDQRNADHRKLLTKEFFTYEVIRFSSGDESFLFSQETILIRKIPLDVFQRCYRSIVKDDLETVDKALSDLRKRVYPLLDYIIE